MLFLLLLSLCNLSRSLPLTSTFDLGSEKICSHKYPVVSEVPHPITLEGKGRIDKRSAENRLRIKVFFDDSVKNLTARQRVAIKQEVVPNAVSFWEEALSIRGNDGTIHIQRKCENNQYFLGPDDPTQYCRNNCVSTSCGEFQVPQEHLGPCFTCDSQGRDCKQESEAGVGIDDADFVLYVSALQTVQCGEAIGEEASTVAYAAHCQQESTLDRPIAGHTNICPKAIKTDPDSVHAMTSTVKHELLHALGFSSSLFAFYRDKDGKPLTERGSDGKPPINRQLQIRQWSDKIIKKVTRSWLVRSGRVTRTFNLIVTPKVKEEVRRHFNCSKLEGAELEDQGGDGTALTHWEKRLFQNEAMTGTVHTQDPLYSRITFALMEDSGWYLPNYDMAQEIKWGRNLGCDFATLSCKELMESEEDLPSVEKKYPFCNNAMHGSSRTFCTHDKKAVGSCNLVQFSSKLPEIYQNFEHVENIDDKDIANVGGSVTLADFCPYVQEFTWKTSGSSESSRGTRCENPDNNPTRANNYALEDYGDGSRCFEQAGHWEQKSCSTMKQWKRYGGGCYDYKCDSGLLYIVVRNVSLPCDKPGQRIDIRLSKDEWLHEGSVICPKCSDLCSDCQSDKESPIDPNSLQEDISETCFEKGLNSLGDFFKDFGFNIG